MRNHLTRIERLEAGFHGGSEAITMIYRPIIDPQTEEACGAFGPRILGRPDVTPIHIDREAGEPKAEFMARVDRAFCSLKRVN